MNLVEIFLIDLSKFIYIYTIEGYENIKEINCT